MHFLIKSLILTLISINSYAAVNLTASYYDLETTRYKRVSDRLTYSLGYSYLEKNKIFISLSTNRPFQTVTLAEKNGHQFKIKSRVDSFSIGIPNKIMPSLFLARVDSRTSRSKDINYIYGGSLSYFVDKNIFFSIIGIPSQAFYKNSLGVNITLFL